jgi:hypothetical protein
MNGKDIFSGRTFFIVKAPHDDRNDDDSDWDLVLDQPNDSAHVGVLFDGRHVAQAIIDRLNEYDTAKLAAFAAVEQREAMRRTAWDLRERGQKAHNLLVEFIELCEAGDVDESIKALGWGDLIAEAKAFCGIAPQPVEED